MILEILSFLPWIHEEIQMGKVGKMRSDSVTDSFSSKYSFWEQIEATYIHQKNNGNPVPHLVPFRNNKGELKEISISPNHIQFNKELEKASPKDVGKWVLEYHIKQGDIFGWGQYPIYNHDGEFVEGYRFQLKDDDICCFYCLNEKEYHLCDSFVEWKPIMTWNEWLKKTGRK